MATVVESAGTNGRLTLVKYDDGTILLIDRDNFARYDNITGTNNDNFIDLDDLRNHVNESGIYEFTDSTGGEFDLNTINTRDDLVLTRADGTTYVFDVDLVETYEDYGPGGNDNTIDINEIASNVDDDSIVQFTDSSGGSFTLQPGSEQNGQEFLIIKDDGTVLQVNSDDLFTSTLDPNSDGVIDVDGLAANGSNIWEFYDSSGQDFQIVGSASRSNDIVFAREDGTKLVVDIDDNDAHDDIGSTNNDGRIDINALGNNVAGNNSLYEFYDSTGGEFTLVPLNGDNNNYALQRDDGTAFLFDGDNFGTFEDYNGNTGDGRIDVSEFINNVNSDSIYQVIDSSGGGFTIVGGADDTDYDDVHFARDNGELITVRYDTIESDMDRLAGSANDNVIDLQNLSDNVGSMGSGFKYIATVEPSVVCFTRGTLIKTIDGEQPIEDLTAGDLVLTMDGGYQEVRWIGSNGLGSIDLTMNPELKPIIIRAEALGSGFPEQDLIVSPQHRIFVRSVIAERMFGQREVLIPANKLLTLDGIDILEHSPDGVEYWHILFDDHQIVWSNGAPTESLFTGPEALKAVSPEVRLEIQTLFPEICAPDFKPTAARHIPEKGKLMKKLAQRHQANNKPLFIHP